MPTISMSVKYKFDIRHKLLNKTKQSHTMPRYIQSDQQANEWAANYMNKWTNHSIENIRCEVSTVRKISFFK